MRRTISSYSRRHLVWHENGSAYHTEKIHRIHLIQLHNISRSRSSRFWFRWNYCKQALLWEWTLDNEIEATNLRTHKLEANVWLQFLGVSTSFPIDQDAYLPLESCVTPILFADKAIFLSSEAIALRRRPPLDACYKSLFFFNSLRERNLRSIRNSLVRSN